MRRTEIAAAILSSEPFRTLLRRGAALPYGTQFLNHLSGARGVYTSFDEAWSVARKATPAGHEDHSEVELHLELSRGLRPSDYPVLYWLLKICTGDLRIFDFGGNVGNLYYSYRAHLMEMQRLDWIVFDIPAIIEAGKKIAAQRGATELRFTNSLNEASNCSVLLVSGAIHYWERSVQEFVEQFTLMPEHVILNRTPVHNGHASFITVQRTRQCAFPCIVRNEAEMITAFSSKGYGLVDRWPAFELSLKMPLFPDLTVQHYSGFYFRSL